MGVLNKKINEKGPYNSVNGSVHIKEINQRGP